jgi:regulator of sigma E protease
MLMVWILGAIKIVVVLGTLITIHELGHFLVAKAFKVKIHKFAIGFGPKIFTRKKGDTEYTLRAIPFGGFVLMEGEERYSEDEGAFNKKPVWQRILIVAAGAIVNIIFALILYFGLSYSKGIYISPIIDEVIPNSAALEYGLTVNDKIIRINNKNIISKFDIDTVLADNHGEELEVTLVRNNEKITLPIMPKKEILGTIGVYFKEDSSIASVLQGSPAEKAGLKAGDKITGANGTPNLSIDQIVETIVNSPGSNISFTIDRKGEVFEKLITTDSFETYKLGILCKSVTPKFWGRIYYSIDDTTYFLEANIKGIAGFFTGKVKTAEVMGPVGIAKEISSTEALGQFIYLASAISLSLGLFNLLPIPALDGGRVLILIIEGIRRKPLGEKREIIIQVVGFSFIILIAIIVTVSDIVKLVQ